MKKLVYLFSFLAFCSCAAPKLVVKGVAYQSVNIDSNSISDVAQATIIAKYYIDAEGNVNVMIENGSDEMMTIDRTKSFFQNQGEQAQMYYDPQIITNTQSTTSSSSNGVGVNLGAVAGAVGIGGILGRALGGVNVGGSSTEAVTNSQTSYTIDQPKVSVPPHGSISMGRVFNINGIGYTFLKQAINSSQTDAGKIFDPKSSYASCYICISYSTDGEKTFDMLNTTLYANSIMVSKIRQQGKVNEAVRRLYSQNPKLLYEPWYLMCAPFNIKEDKIDNSGMKQDYVINPQCFINYK